MIDFFCEKNYEKSNQFNTKKLSLDFFCENISKNIYIFEN